MDITMETVYISGRIRGCEDYRERFAAAENYLKNKGFKVINPAKTDDLLPEGSTFEQYMEIDMKLLSMCDAIYMLRGWEESCGANREYGYALAKGMEVYCE